jgi:outer membrane protein OmpA-like peptidoglycan-associated protein
VGRWIAAIALAGCFGLALHPSSVPAQGPAPSGDVSGEAAPASGRGPELRLGFYAGAFFPSEQHEFYDWRANDQQPLAALGPELGFRLGFFPLRFLGVEGEADVVPTSTEAGQRALLYGARAHLILRVPARVTPFLLGGFGTMGVRSDQAALSSDNDAIGHLGLGAELGLGERSGLRVEGRALRAPRAGTDGGTNHFALLVGLSWSLGGRDERDAALVERARAEPARAALADARPAAGAAAEPRPGPADRDPDPGGAAGRDDRCPLEPGSPAASGCPDSDRDGDGVADPVDNCPDQVGRADRQGCISPQLVELTLHRLVPLAPITFTTNRAAIRRRSLRVLDGVAAVLQVHPEIERVRVSGHTDDRGPAPHNLKLSQRRADAVRGYLVQLGIAGGRLESIGRGEEQPLQSNGTAIGRAQNRRVEFEIVSPPRPDDPPPPRPGDPRRRPLRR